MLRMMRFCIFALLITFQPTCSLWISPKTRQQPHVNMETSGTRFNNHGGMPGQSRADKTRLDRIVQIFLRVLPKATTDSTSPDEDQGLDVYMIETGRESYSPFVPSPPGNQEGAWWELNDTEPSFPVEDNDYTDGMRLEKEFPSGQDYEENEDILEDGNIPRLRGDEAKHIPVLQKRKQSSQMNTAPDANSLGGTVDENYLQKRFQDISRWLGEKRMNLDRWYLIERARYRRFRHGMSLFWGRLLGIKLGYKLTSEK